MTIKSHPKYRRLINKKSRNKRNNREKREETAHTLQAAEKTFLPGPVPQGTFYQVTPRLTH